MKLVVERDCDVVETGARLLELEHKVVLGVSPPHASEATIAGDALRARVEEDGAGGRVWY